MKRAEVTVTGQLKQGNILGKMRCQVFPGLLHRGQMIFLKFRMYGWKGWGIGNGLQGKTDDFSCDAVHL